MAVRVNEVHRVIIAIAIEVQTVDRFRIQVSDVIERDKSAPFGAVIAGITVVEAGVMVEAVAIVTNMGGFATATSAYLFYHLPRLQSRKSLPDRDWSGRGILEDIDNL